MQATAWRNWHEWQSVRLKLFSNDIKIQMNGVHDVRIWKSRTDGKLPIAVTGTADLIEVICIDVDENIKRLSCGTVILRTINGLVDQLQKGSFAAPVSVLAMQLALPLWLIDIRHDVAHNKLPSIHVLNMAGNYLLEWLVNNYWEKQANCLFQAAESASSLLAMAFSTNSFTIELQNPQFLRNLLVPMMIYGERYGYKCPAHMSLLEQHPRNSMLELKKLQHGWIFFGSSMFLHIMEALLDSKHDNDELYLSWAKYFLSTAWHQEHIDRQLPFTYCSLSHYENVGFPIEAIHTILETHLKSSNPYIDELHKIISDIGQIRDDQFDAWHPFPIGISLESMLFKEKYTSAPRSLKHSTCYLDQVDSNYLTHIHKKASPEIQIASVNTTPVVEISTSEPAPIPILEIWTDDE